MGFGKSRKSCFQTLVFVKNMLTPQKKQRIINKYKTHAKDTGSAEVQIAILTEEIKDLTKHLRTHKHDHSSRRGLLKKLGERRRLLRYLESDNLESFEKLVKDLNIKISRRTISEPEEELIEETAGTPVKPAAPSSEEKQDKKQEK